MIGIRGSRLAIGLLVLDAFWYAFGGVISRVLSEGFEPLTQVYLRIGLGLVLALAIYGKRIWWGQYKTLPKRDWVALGLIGVVGYGLMVYFITLGVLNTKLINVSVLYATVPMMVYLISIIVFGKKSEV